MNWVKEKLAELYPDMDDPFMDAEQITPSDTVELENYTRGVWIGVGGDVVMILAASGTAVTFKNIPSGTMIPMVIRQIKLTGTTAQNIVGMW